MIGLATTMSPAIWGGLLVGLALGGLLVMAAWSDTRREADRSGALWASPSTIDLHTIKDIPELGNFSAAIRRAWLSGGFLNGVLLALPEGLKWVPRRSAAQVHNATAIRVPWDQVRGAAIASGAIAMRRGRVRGRLTVQLPSGHELSLPVRPKGLQEILDERASFGTDRQAPPGSGGDS